MDLNIYTEEMSKSIWDKAFFMDKIPGVKCVIDFGCADGAMIRFLAPLFPDIYFIGYDINNELIERGQSAIPFYPNVQFYCKHPHNSLDAFISFTKDKFKPDEICINFSSVLHEVFSSTDGKEDIQQLVCELRPKYITIRDMYCDDPVAYLSSVTPHEKVVPILDKITEKYANAREKMQDYAKHFGMLENWRDVTHLLMKFQWVNNGWNEELKENYFSWTLNDMFKLCPNYSPIFECRYQLPYLSEEWRESYEWYNPDVHTHAQFILRRDK